MAEPAPAPTRGVPFSEALRTWLKIGLLGFGGPAGQIALMHRILVEEKRWISEGRFLHALNYCMLLPGPEAQQLATYVGWLLHRTAGGLAAGILFVLPGALCVLALSILYAAASDLAIVQALFFGLKPAVFALVAEAVLRVGKRALKTRAQVALAVLAFAALFFFGVQFPYVVAAAALIGFVGGRARPDLFPAPGVHAPKAAHASAAAPVVDDLLESGASEHTRPTWTRALKVAAISLALWFAPIAACAAVFGEHSLFVDLGLFFSKAAVVTFGGAYAVLAYLAQAAVQDFGWISTGEMLDGLGLAETTPGPLILVTQFVGFLAAHHRPGELDPCVAGLLGAGLTTWVTFVPCFLWIFLGAPYVETLRRKRALGAALSAITAAVVGVIANLALWFGLHVVFRSIGTAGAGWMAVPVPDLSSVDLLALALAVGALVAVLWLRVKPLWMLAGSAVVGAIAFALLRA